MWYRTYRPQTIAELHLPAAKAALERIRTSGEFAHAYLFAGPKGTGKTSSARILAKLLNCVKNEALVKKALTAKNHKAGAPLHDACGECARCTAIAKGSSFCVVEMDAASNRGIDDIRALRERIYLAPSDGLVSVYIIDEVHMLTTEAFNALLKVLEEPPAHVVFVLATTELHKLPETVVSRCVLVRFSRAEKNDILASFAHVLEREHIAAAPVVLEKIAELAEGSFRDAIKLLEHLAQGKKSLGEDDLRAVGMQDTREVAQLVEALQNRDATVLSALFLAMEKKRVDLGFVQKAVLARIHTLFVDAVGRSNASASSYGALLEKLNVAQDGALPFPHLPFELACFAWCLEGRQSSGEEKKESRRVEKKEVVPPTPVEAAESAKEEAKAEEVVDNTSMSLTSLEGQWQTILNTVKKSNATIEALLRAARPTEAHGTTITIEVFYPFHKEQLEHERHRRILENVIRETCGVGKTTLKFVLGKRVKKDTAVAEKKVEDEALVKAAEEVFAE